MSGFQFGAAPAQGGTALPSLGGTGGSFSFGQAPAVSSMAPTAAVAPTLSFGGLGGVSAPSTTSIGAVPTMGLGGGGGATTGFSFAKPPATTATSASLNFGTTTTSTTALPTGLVPPATAPTPFVGLGGIDMSSAQPKAGDSKQDVKVKETQVPDEISKTVNSLKTHIKTQKTISSDIGRTSTSKLTNVSGEVTNLQWALQEIANSVEANYHQIKVLRKETSKAIQAVEMAQRTQDTPAGLQFENSAPFQYFHNLVAKYEQDLINFRQQIELTERHMQALANPQSVSPDDLKHGFQQINECFISLAGRLHEIHQRVEAQKEQYLNLRKYRLHDSANVFDKIDNPVTKVDMMMKVSAGPTPFSSISAMSSLGKIFATTGGASGTAANK